MDATLFSNVKLIILDVDGVFTDGTKVFDRWGNVVFKSFLDKDFTALNEITKYFYVVILSGDDRVNKAIFTNKGLPFYHSRKKPKKTLLKIILRKYNVGPDECIFVGDDLPDLQCMQLIPLSFCPKDAVHEVKQYAEVLPVLGGKGVIVALYNILKEEIMLRRKLC